MYQKMKMLILKPVSIETGFRYVFKVLYIEYNLIHKIRHNIAGIIFNNNNMYNINILKQLSGKRIIINSFSLVVATMNVRSLIDFFFTVRNYIRRDR